MRNGHCIRRRGNKVAGYKVADMSDANRALSVPDLKLWDRNARVRGLLVRGMPSLRYSVRMSTSPATPATPRKRVIAPLMLTLLGICGMSAIWTLLALIIDRQCAWIAVLSAADIALLLRLGRAAPGLPRAATAVVATLATILLTNWVIAAAQIGGPMGLGLIDSVQRLGTDYAQTLFSLANQPAELAWYAIAVIIALWLGR
jgi:hypothetical protein